MSTGERVDWGARWIAARCSSSRGKARGTPDPAAFWDKKAPWFERNTRGDDAEAHWLMEKVPVVGTSVLDIGAGAGRFSIPLARVARSLTAVEPSAGMASFLHERARQEGIDTITLVPKRWEDVVPGADVGPHDVVIAPYSLDVDDMWAALKKIVAVTGQHAFIMTWMRRTFWDFETLWPLVHGEPFIEDPGYIYIVNMLHDAGIHANVEIFTRRKDKVFLSVGEALEDLKELLFIDDDARDHLLKEHVTSVLVPHDDGTLHQPGTSERVAIWWPARPIA